MEAWPDVLEEPTVSVDVGCRISAISSWKKDPIRSVKGYRNSEQSSAARESLGVHYTSERFMTLAGPLVGGRQ